MAGLTGFSLYAQYEVDALRFSRHGLNGTTRFISMGGALGAVGADFSLISTNPGGLGLFRSSQLTFSPGFNFGTSQSQWQQNEFGDNRFGFQFVNVGAIFNKRMDRPLPMGIQAFNFAIGYNRLNSYNRSLYFEGENATHALGELFMNRANGLTPSQLDAFTEQLGFNTYLIDTVPGENATKYSTSGLFADENKFMSRQITAKGSMGEIAFGAAVNFGHRLYVGATLGILRLGYNEVSEYNEADTAHLVPGFNNLLLREKLQVEGTGINLKAGLVWRVTDWMRLGLGIHTPGFMEVTETYNSDLRTRFESAEYFADSPTGHFEYDLTMPWRWNASVAFIVGQKITLAGEYEMANFSQIRLRSTGNFFNSVNQWMGQHYGLSHLLKAGAEFRLDPWRFRAGYQYYTDPVNEAGGADHSITTYAAGIGYRARKWIWFDAAFLLNQTNGLERIYRDFATTDPAKVSLQQYLLQFTLGFIF